MVDNSLNCVTIKEKVLQIEDIMYKLLFLLSFIGIFVGVDTMESVDGMYIGLSISIVSLIFFVSSFNKIKHLDEY